MINNFFAEIGPKLADKIAKPNGGTTIFGDVNPVSFEMRQFTLDELLKHIKNTSIYKSSGIQDLSTRFLKNTMFYMPNVFLHIYNRVSLTGVFPDTWKVATVVPLPKCNNQNDLFELRPVSLLPIIGKLMEKLRHVQLSQCFENSKYLSRHQHGFRKGFSTTSVATKFVCDIALRLHKGHYTLAVFVDIKKAFDTIDHEIII